MKITIAGRKCALFILVFATRVAAYGQTAAVSPAHQYFTDVVLEDQNGKQRRLYTDLLQGKVVIINSFFATCKDSCPIMARNFAKIQESLGDRIGKDVYLLSFTVDQVTETPERLKTYSEQIKARPGWLFLTGSKPNVDYALSRLGLYTQEKTNHLTLFIIGNEPTGLWKKVQGTASSDDLIRVVETVLSDHQ